VSPQEWVERDPEAPRRHEDFFERARREHEASVARMDARANEWKAQMASSFALLAAVFLAIGSVAYFVAARTDSNSERPAALLWGAAFFGCIAAVLSGLAWLSWRQAGPHSRGAPLALLVLLAGGVLVVFALRLVSEPVTIWL
jgi:hypothetical protein